MRGNTQIDRARCKGCALCIEFCPKSSIALSQELNLKGYFVATVDPEGDCTGCGTCAIICPEVAIEVERA